MLCANYEQASCLRLLAAQCSSRRLAPFAPSCDKYLCRLQGSPTSTAGSTRGPWSRPSKQLRHGLYTSAALPLCAPLCCGRPGRAHGRDACNRSQDSSCPPGTGRTRQWNEYAYGRGNSAGELLDAKAGDDSPVDGACSRERCERGPAAGNERLHAPPECIAASMVAAAVASSLS